MLSSLENLRVIKFHPSRFMPFVIALREHANVDLTCTLLTFLNTLVNSCDALEDRVLVRNELLENGCAAAFPDLRKWAARHDGPDFRAIETQIEVFETERKQDVRDTTRGAVDLANADEVFAFVRAAAAEDGFSAQFLQTLQLMMTVPADREMGYAPNLALSTFVDALLPSILLMSLPICIWLFFSI